MAKLLIVDDDKETCEFLQEFFESRKCIVFTANSGNQGLSIVKEQNPDIVLLDIKMDQYQCFRFFLLHHKHSQFR